MACYLDRLTPERSEAHWAEIEQYAQSAADRSFGRYEAKHIRQFATDGIWQLWRVMRDAELVAVCGTELLTYPTGLRSVAIRFCAGRGREEWQHLVEEILVQAKAQGCGLGEGCFRPGWRRVLPGWHHSHDVLERSL